MKTQHILAAAFVTAGLFATPALALDRKVDIVNKTGYTMTAFYASNVNEESWEEDMLGGDVLRNGETLEADIDDGTGHCVYDFKARFADGDTVVQRKINVCEVGQFTFTP
ncbi:hypothetical protein ACT6QH_09370 [Xanthobacter sp. TB0139]|uniref:hypothetical protein n=1 Tax=Xanthobacter sp. TB0139 TaxID=3459178 RepID=UPI0040398516